MLWRHFRREVTHCELFETVKALLAATRDFFDRYNQTPEKVLSIIGSYVNPQNLVACT
jgi:putative transposase